MGLLKNKNFLIGIISSCLWTSISLVLIVVFLSEVSFEESLRFFYRQNKLGGLISLAALTNLPAFFIALRYKQDRFASGILLMSFVLVVIIMLLKLNA